jgi:hypothetical protein
MMRFVEMMMQTNDYYKIEMLKNLFFYSQIQKDRKAKALG